MHKCTMNDHCEQCPSQSNTYNTSEYSTVSFIESLRLYVHIKVHKWVSKKCQCTKTKMTPFRARFVLFS